MESKNSNNRSVRRTKERLKACMLRLLAEKSANSITVKELCDMADVNRGTFYFHYNDIYDLLTNIENEFFTNLYAILEKLEKQPNNIPGSEINALTEVFSFFYKNSDFCNIMFGKNGDIAFVEKSKKLVSDKCCDLWQKGGADMSDYDTALMNSFIVNGFLGLLQTAIESKMKKTPEELAKHAARFITPIIESAIKKLPEDNNRK